MEQHTVVISILHVLQEIVAVQRCLVVECNADSATVGNEFHLAAGVGLRLCQYSYKAEEKKDDSFFHINCFIGLFQTFV